MHRLVCAFVVHIQQNQVFLPQGPFASINDKLKSSSKSKAKGKYIKSSKSRYSLQVIRVVQVRKHVLYRGSYMSAHVLLNLLNELGKRDKMRGLPSILSVFRNEFNKFNNT